MTTKITIRAHDTFYIRKGWLDKGMRKVDESPNVFTSKTENPMDVLGIGANMVKSLRYWMRATGLCDEKPDNRKKVQVLSPFGNLVYSYDPYLEETGTLWAIHYNLATNRELATSWYYFFNLFPLKSFSRDEYEEMMIGYIDMLGAKRPSRRSIEDDFNCIISTYTPKERLNPTKTSPENNIDCPLSELYLTDVENKRKHLFRKQSKSCSEIPWEIVSYATYVFAIDKRDEKERYEIPISELVSAECSPGKVFCLDTINLTTSLYEAQRNGFVKVIRTAGLDVVKLEPIEDRNFFLERYYSDMGMEALQ